jgi:hypothetical protein
MRRWVAILTALLAVATGMSRAAPIVEMTPETIKEAIAYGQTPGNHPEKTFCYKIKGESKGGWLWGLFGSRYAVEGCLITPFLRVACAAGVAQYKKQKFTERNVTKEMIEPKVSLIVTVTGPVGFPTIRSVIVARGDYTREPSLLLPPQRETTKEGGTVVEVQSTVADFTTMDFLIANEVIVVLEDGMTLRIDLGYETMKDVR